MSGAAALGRLIPGTGTDRRAVALLSAGHVGADLFLGAVPALVPFFVAERGLRGQYHYNAISTWRIDDKGEASNAFA